jgi:hypothetical protein
MTEKATKPTKRTKKIKPDLSVPDSSKLLPWANLNELNSANVKYLYANHKNPMALGIDASLTGTVVAFFSIENENYNIKVYDLSKSIFVKGVARVVCIYNRLLSLLETYSCDVVLLEDYAHGAANQAHALGELGFAMRYALGSLLFSVGSFNARIGTVPIGTWKKSLGLAGNAPKIAVQMWLAERYSLYIQNNDIADAISIAIYGMSLITGEIPAKGSVINVTYF